MLASKRTVNHKLQALAKFGLEVEVLWGPSIYDMGTWTLRGKHGVGVQGETWGLCGFQGVRLRV